MTTDPSDLLGKPVVINYVQGPPVLGMAIAYVDQPSYMIETRDGKRRLANAQQVVLDERVTPVPTKILETIAALSDDYISSEFVNDPEVIELWRYAKNQGL